MISRRVPRDRHELRSILLEQLDPSSVQLNHEVSALTQHASGKVGCLTVKTEERECCLPLLGQVELKFAGQPEPDQGDAEAAEARRFDVVVGADGLDSVTRRFVLGVADPGARDVGGVVASGVVRLAEVKALPYLASHLYEEWGTALR